MKKERDTMLTKSSMPVPNQQALAIPKRTAPALTHRQAQCLSGRAYRVTRQVYGLVNGINSVLRIAVLLTKNLEEILPILHWLEIQGYITVPVLKNTPPSIESLPTLVVTDFAEKMGLRN